MEHTVGEILEGKVKSLTKFGAFVTFDDGSTGMVHISEIAHTFVSDIRQHLTEGDTVKVMVIGVDDKKINLPIKRTQPQSRADRPQRSEFDRKPHNRPSFDRKPADAASSAPQKASFDDMLKQFMSESDSKMSSIRQYQDHKTKTRRR